MSSTKYNVLIVATTKEDLASFSKIKKAHAGCQTLFKDKLTQYKAFYDSFQEGSKQSTFDFVIAFLGEETQIDDIQMQEEFFAHYIEAPIFNWVSSASDAYLTEIGGQKSKVFTYTAGAADEEKGAAVLEALNHSIAEYERISANVVKPAFDKYDKDGSGGIDKEELA